MKRVFVGTLVAGALLGTGALAQFPPASPPPVPMAPLPPTSYTGTFASVHSGGAVLQMPGGRQANVSFNRGMLIVDATSEPLSAGMRVYVVGTTQNDGSIAASEIDVVASLRYMDNTPVPAMSPAVIPTQ